MAKSLRSKKERAKRREKRYKDRLPREKARLRKLAEAAMAREAKEKEQVEETGGEEIVRWRRQRKTYKHVRALRSRPVAYQTEEIIPKEYVAKRRDYERFLDHTEPDSDDNDILSESDSEFQEASRSLDKRTPEAKERAMDLDGVVEKKLQKLKSKGGKLPKWLSRQDRKKMKAYKTRGIIEDDIIFDYA